MRTSFDALGPTTGHVPALAMLTCSFVFACSGAAEPREQKAAALEAAKAAAEYPHATWRFARERLQHVMLKVSQIAIRHRDAEDGDLKLRGPDWMPDPRVARTRAEALELATRIAESLRARPSDFAAAARVYSEDAVTAPFGGSLGTLAASQLPPQFLDAIAALRPGEISRPFETPFGVHLLKLDVTPQPETVAAARVVIAYRYGGISRLRPGHARERSRAEALELAREVAAAARLPGADFAALVERYSDSPDAAQAGDFGVWSTHSPHGYGLALEAITGVPIGGITEPVDGGEGFAVLKRTPAEERERFAASYVLLAESIGEQRADVRARMATVLAAVRAEPASFETYQRQYCCTGSESWSKGRGPGPQLEAALVPLRDGEIATSPVETPSGLYLVKRLSPPPIAAPLQVLLRLPTPDSPNLDDVVKHTNGAGLANALHALRRGLPALMLAESVRRDLDALLASTSDELVRSPAGERPAVLAAFWTRAAGVLPAPQLELLQEHVLDFTKQLLMQD